MAAVRQLEARPADHVGGQARHLRLVGPGPSRVITRRQAGIYRRRRLLAALVVAVCALALLRLAAPLPADPGAIVREAGSIHVVQPGDTYWSIAASLDSDGDMTGAVDALSAANRGRALQVGDHLALPG